MTGQVINTNILSMNAQRNLSTSQSSLASALQRLSSGLRINSAKDDAAGLAISERFTTQIRGLNQAIRNANDGISLSQTGEGALAELSSNLQRIRELAVQAANATNSASDRVAIDREVQQRLAEIDRIASQTSFNGQKILDGTFGSAAFQVGANVGETISLSLNTSMRTSAIGAASTVSSVDLSALITEAVDAVPTTSPAAGTFTSAVLADTETFTLSVAGVNIVNETAGAGGGTIAAGDLDTGLAAAAGDLATAGISYTGTFAAGTIVFSRASGEDFTIAVTNTGAGGTFAGAGFVGAQTNGTEAASASPLAITGLTFQFGDNDPVSVAAGSYTSAAQFVAAVNTAIGGAGFASLNSNGTMTLTSSAESITVAGADAGTVFSTTSATAGGNLTTVNVLNVAAANDAIYRVDAALTAVSDLRSTFGAIQNRFESTIANLSSVVENLSASRSRIMDADYAAETAALTRAQVLQQAGIAMLAQANVAPQNVLALLR